MDIVLLFPGQGSQKPGMAKDLVEAFPAARDVFDRADAALGFALSTLCFEGPAEELTLTHNAQPALLAHGAAVWAATRAAIGASVVALLLVLSCLFGVKKTARIVSEWSTEIGVRPNVGDAATGLVPTIV